MLYYYTSPAKSKREEDFNDYNGSNANANSNSNMASASTLQSSASSRGQYNKYKEYQSNYSNNSRDNINSANCIQVDSFIDSAQNNLPKPFERRSNDDFALSLQKGFQDIVNMYTTSYNKPKVSFQCIYFCNLNVRHDKTFGDDFQQYYEMFEKRFRMKCN